MLDQNPLAVGAVALDLGAAVGLAVPETEREEQMMGPAHERVKRMAESKAGETTDKVGRVAEQARSAAQDEAKRQGLAS